MNEKELLEMEDEFERRETNQTLFLKILDLIAEIRRLNDLNKKDNEEWKIVDNAWKAASDNLQKQSQLYKDLYTKENTQNMVYKRALEDIEQCNGIIDIYDAKKRAFIALEVKHD